MNKVLCFGELLLRLSPELSGKWIAEGSMPVFIGGAELNVARALALWGDDVAYGTALPDHYLSAEVMDFIRSKNMDTGRIRLSGKRIGTYYLPQGADLKAAGVIYDREHSSFWELQPGQINWDEVLEGISWFHFSAISPALNENVAAVCREALVAAEKRGIFISVDLNYRAKLWQYGKQPSEIMPSLVQHCNLVMGNIWAAEKMLGIPVPSEMADKKESYLLQSEKSSAAIVAAFPKVQYVANTFRFDRGEGVQYFATLLHENSLFVSEEHQTNYIVDKVGSGDCFMGGLIHALTQGYGQQGTISFAAAAAFNKLFIKGDATTSTVAEIKKRILDHA